MKAEIVNRLEKLEARHGRTLAGGRRIDQYRIVGILPDGSEGCSAVIKIPPVMRNGNMNFSGFTDDEVRALARVRIEAD